MTSDPPLPWPNIVLVDGRLFRAGACVTLPAEAEGVDLTGASRAVGGQRARLLMPCVATKAQDREWLEAQESRGMRAAMVAFAVVLIPTAT